ncbi:hypothetical protein [Sporosarcina sp. Te-1]|uniref:hypothetical protein n=1 Tax=Sporosarcina sp. Te-1 TaxID=2818390 RepID=UPI001A9F8E24|nr:hypothetical protein [Sporosarcina sp. Te-1]QTD40942.1 hypothetical protein J3U78_19735 [Sporosarcina sp. Te-1]
MEYYYNPEVYYLLLTQSTQKMEIRYADNLIVEAPEIGPRPPYFANPNYQSYVPLI